MSTVRIAFLGTPEFARYHLSELLADDHYKVVGVVTQPDRPSGRHMHLKPSPVKELALQRNIPVLDPENFKSENVLNEIKKWQAEAAVVVAYGQILPQSFLDLFPSKVVNVHGSLLPRWRGAAPVQRAIEAGDQITGVSLQVMVKKLDAGDVIGSYKMAIDDKINAAELLLDLQPLGARLLHIDFMDYLKGHITPMPQDESQVTYAHKLEKNQSAISWAKTSVEIVNQIRAFVLGPGTSCVFNGKKMKIHQAHSVTNSTETSVALKPGQIHQVRPEGIQVACGKGLIELTEVQMESRPKMSVKEFVTGHTIKAGDTLT